MDIKRFAEIRKQMPTADGGVLRFHLFEINTWWTNLDWRKLRDFWWDETEEAIEEIVKALKERHKVRPSATPWTEKMYYEEARLYLEQVRLYDRTRDPRQLRSYLAQDLGLMQRKDWVTIAARNDAPKKRRGRKRKVVFTYIKGNWDGSHHDELPWYADDLWIKPAS